MTNMEQNKNTCNQNFSTNRRNLIKTGILGIGATLALSGCDKKEDNLSKLEIKPKQTEMYEFSCPLPFNFKTIDEIVELNSTLKKSKVTTFYNNIPLPLADNYDCWIKIVRGKNEDIKSYDDFFKYVKYAADKGFKFTYLMNSPKPFSERDFLTFKDDVYYLLDYLDKTGCHDIKVANTQVAQLINEYAPDKFNLHVSTAFEYHNISQYKYLFNNYPNFNLIDITNDENHNFKLLKALRENFANIKLELMVNQACIKGCPARISHLSINDFFVFDCQKLRKDMKELHFFLKTGVIYPWNLEYYSSLGINNFKIVIAAMNNGKNNFRDISILKSYLEAVEYGVDDMTVKAFFTKIFTSMRRTDIANSKISQSLKMQEIMHLFPNIKHFIAHGHECSAKCGIECNYCYEYSKKIEEKLIKS